MSGQSFRFVVIGCMEADEDPSGLLEFGGSGVHPDVPRAEIEAALRADAQDDGADEAASVARNVEASRRFLEFGPTFGWQRFIEYGDVVALTLDQRVVEGEGAWFSVEAMEGGTFIEREGRTFRGTTPVENMATGETGTLRFEAICP
ncbi:MAG: hypothetical protein EA422_02985 [Gemmatimonadales bacterium]|nr:MAG: hypothetical protein EA422_02985 [Gemmatimonadales bacterium]